MRELQSRHQQFETERPLMAHSPWWYKMRAGMELDELGDELIDDPNLWERERIASEIADVILFLIPLANRYGIILEDAVAAKLEHNERRFKPDDFNGTNFPDFSSAYANVKRSEGKSPTVIVSYESPFLLDNNVTP